MLSMITRRYDPPDHSFFLFGPRGAGKSTWLKQTLTKAPALLDEVHHTNIPGRFRSVMKGGHP